MQWHPLDEPLGLAVSGGPDSLALMLLAHGLMGDLCQVATVDHGLRPESADEAAMVAELCVGLGLAHRTLSVQLARGNVQSEARAARYGALDQWGRAGGMTAIATAHHADDQAETVLMRLNRGSGLAGLAGIRACTFFPDGMQVVRPLLDWRKEELRAIVAKAGIRWAEDPSNGDPQFDRARIRKALTSASWLDPSAISTSARHVADAERVLRLIEREDFARCVETTADAVIYAPHANGRGDGYELIHARVAARIFDEIFKSAPRFSEVRRLVDNLTLGSTGSLAGCHVVPRQGAEGPVWTFRREPARRNGPLHD